MASESSVTKTSTRYSSRSEKVDLSESSASHRELRTVNRYEADANKAVPKIILIKRTESARQDLHVPQGAGGSFTETSINLSIKSKQTSASSTDMKDNFDKVAENIKREKNSLQDLNTRLSGHIEKVRYLEQQNKKLVDELDGLRNNWVTDTMNVKEEFGSLLVRNRKQLNDAELVKVHVEVELASAEDRCRELTTLHEEATTRNARDIEDILQLRELVAEYESELNLLRKRVTSFDTENDKDKNELERLKKNVESLRINLDNETENHVQAELAVQNAREELEFISAIHEAEIKELENLVYKESSSESRGFWRNELAQALEEIQTEYDSRVEDVKSELEITYEKKVTEASQSQAETQVEVAQSEEVARARSESEEMKVKCKTMEVTLSELTEKHRKLAAHLAELQKQLEEGKRSHDKEKLHIISQISSTQNELDRIVKELRVLLDAKLSLDLQIAAYRKLIESEESRLERDANSNEALSVISSLISARATSLESQVTTRTTTEVSKSASEISAKTSFSRNAKGSVSIKEGSPDGRYVKLEHLAKRNPKREDIGGWKLSRTVEGQSPVEFVFPEGTFLDPDGANKELIIWASGRKPANASSRDLEISQENWGVGPNIVTKLFDANGDEKATHTQTTVYSGTA